MLKTTSDQNTIPLISVALPVYNGEAYLAEAVDSILAQSFTNFELIIIDDGSTDDSLRVLREFEKRDARIRLVARENRNLATTLNDIIDMARGKWVARMDQDDIALPHRFARQLAWLTQTEADICGSWALLFGAASHRVLKHPQSDAANKVELLFGCAFAHPTVIMKTELVKQLRYDKTWEKCEDYDLWERAARANWKMTNVPEVLLHYRLHEAQISNTMSPKQQALTQQIRRRYWEFVSDSMLLKKEWVDEVLKLREPSPPTVNMNVVDSVFTKLLQENQDEARATILEHATRLYFRAAATCPSVAIRWHKLNQRFGDRTGFTTVLELAFLSMFKCSPKNRFFQKLKKIHLHLG
ncbi:MAG: glycosyltransferase [Gallionella sp.]|nr:glycosyltransferase [Gallionella sp.]MDD4957805.1 glycosyltransferase [Gallionella sp.]